MRRAPWSACLSPEPSFRKASLSAEVVQGPLPPYRWSLTVRPHHGVTATHRPPDLDAALGSLQTSPNGSWQSLTGEGWRHGKNPGSFHLHMQKVLARAGSGDWERVEPWRFPCFGSLASCLGLSLRKSQQFSKQN